MANYRILDHNFLLNMTVKPLLLYIKQQKRSYIQQEKKKEHNYSRESSPSTIATKYFFLAPWITMTNSHLKNLDIFSDGI